MPAKAASSPRGRRPRKAFFGRKGSITFYQVTSSFGQDNGQRLYSDHPRNTNEPFKSWCDRGCCLCLPFLFSPLLLCTGHHVYLLIVPLHENEPADTRRRHERKRSQEKIPRSLWRWPVCSCLLRRQSASRRRPTRLSHPALPAGVGKRKSRDVLRAYGVEDEASVKSRIVYGWELTRDSPKITWAMTLYCLRLDCQYPARYTGRVAPRWHQSGF